MDATEIYKNVNITNRDFIQILKNLGFIDESDEKIYRFVHKKQGAELTLPLRPLDEYVQRIYLAAYAYRLYMLGIIKTQNAFVTTLENEQLPSTPSRAKDA